MAISATPVMKPIADSTWSRRMPTTSMRLPLTKMAIVNAQNAGLNTKPHLFVGDLEGVAERAGDVAPDGEHDRGGGDRQTAGDEQSLRVHPGDPSVGARF